MSEAEDRDAMILTRSDSETCCEFSPPMPVAKYACTRSYGHDGQHVAVGDGTRILARWPKLQI